MNSSSAVTDAPPHPRANIDATIWNLPNVLTLSRLGLAVVLFVGIYLEQWPLSLGIFIIAAVTDWLDGYLARKQGLTSAFGRNLDPLVDKVLVCGAFIFLLPVPGAGLAAWMVTVVVARELIVTGLRSYFEARQVAFGADRIGKIKMVLQCAALIAIFVVLSTATERRPALAPVRDAIVLTMMAATIISGAQYSIKAIMHFNKPH